MGASDIFTEYVQIKSYKDILHKFFKKKCLIPRKTSKQTPNKSYSGFLCIGMLVDTEN